MYLIGKRGPKIIILGSIVKLFIKCVYYYYFLKKKLKKKWGEGAGGGGGGNGPPLPLTSSISAHVNWV